MSYLLLTGIVLLVVPLLIIIGFATFIFLAFVRDDDEATALFRIMLIVMLVGALLIGAHYAGQAIG
ncbi:MAG: hypothetical protein ABIA47_02300 [bacterium]